VADSLAAKAKVKGKISVQNQVFHNEILKSFVKITSVKRDAITNIDFVHSIERDSRQNELADTLICYKSLNRIYNRLRLFTKRPPQTSVARGP
jgi:hypothetical protein